MIEVIGAGWGRTGTFSLKSALERLGFGPCYHMFDLVRHHPEHAADWLAAARHEPVDWDRVLDGYRSAVDWPVCAFWRELMDHAPDARIVLTTRPPEDWYGSFQATISAGIPLEDPGDDDAMDAMIHEVIVGKSFAGRTTRDEILSAYREHVDDVRAAVPVERLLEWSVADGWGSLCRFLGVEVPEEPFPHVNTRDEFVGRSRRRRRD